MCARERERKRKKKRKEEQEKERVSDVCVCVCVKSPRVDLLRIKIPTGYIFNVGSRNRAFYWN